MKMFRFDKKDIFLKYSNLSRLIMLMMVANLSTFVASGLVKGFNYYFPLIALGILTFVELLLTFPYFNIGKDKRCYNFMFVLVWIAAYFTISSFIYMVSHGDYSSIPPVPISPP